MNPASNYVENVDLAFKVVFGISFFFLISITSVMIYFVIRYRRSKHPQAVQIKDNTALEIIWTIIPLLLVLLLFYFNYIAFKPQVDVPKDAMNVKVIAKMWFWTFEYEGGKQSPTLVLPVNKPVNLLLHSDDVIHSLYIPAFRIKQDVVPGKENNLWFIPEQVGEYEILCSAYCGLRHSYMEAKAKVVPEEEYKTWLGTIQSVSSEAPGLKLIKKNACTGCHSLDGSRLVSASFKGLYGKTERVTTDGKERELNVDDEYIKTSIYEPEKDVVVGYPKGVMRSYKGILKDEDVKNIIEYLKTLK